MSETKIVVRYAETDMMGIVHHSNYPIWFEAGRTDLIKLELNISYRQLEERGLLLPLIGLHSYFKSPARYEDIVIVRTKIFEAGIVKLSFSYEVVNESSNRLLATGSTEHAWTATDFRPVNIKRKAPELYEALTRAQN